MLNSTSDLDEPTAAYVFAVQRPFENLRQALGQVAGWLVLAALRTADAIADHPALTSAAALVRDSADDLRGMHTTARVRTHHACVMRAARTLDSAVRDAQSRPPARTGAEVERLSAAVRSAYADLAQAARALPGFEMVSFAHACCARQDLA